jgi:hypothetical protein
MGLVDRALWENQCQDPQAIEAELRGPKGRGWLMRWLPARAHDNGLFLVFSNSVGVDDASLLEVSTGKRWIVTRRPKLYGPLTVPTGLEQGTRAVRFDKRGV